MRNTSSEIGRGKSEVRSSAAVSPVGYGGRRPGAIPGDHRPRTVRRGRRSGLGMGGRQPDCQAKAGAAFDADGGRSAHESGQIGERGAACGAPSSGASRSPGGDSRFHIGRAADTRSGCRGRVQRCPASESGKPRVSIRVRAHPVSRRSWR